jgi:hypothetical protein
MERDHLHEGDLGMKVKIIHPGGMLDEHNKRNPGAAVELGDLIVSVNGVRGNWDEMLAEFAKESVVVEVERPLQRSVARSEPARTEVSVGDLTVGANGWCFGNKFDTETGQPIPKFDPQTGVQNW